MSLRHIVGRRAALVMVTGVAVLMLGPGCVSSPLEDLAQRTCDRLESDGPTLAPGIFDLAVDEAESLGMDVETLVTELNKRCADRIAALITITEVGSSRIREYPEIATRRVPIPRSDANDSLLDGTSWELSSIDGHSPLSGTHITLRFEDGRASGNAGCNGYGIAYEELKGGLIRFGAAEIPTEGCVDPPGIMRQEEDFVGALAAGMAASYRLAESELEIESGDGETNLMFTRE